MSQAKRDENREAVGLGTSDDANLNTLPLLIDPSTGRLLITVAALDMCTPTKQTLIKRDENRIPVSAGDDGTNITPLHICADEGFLSVDLIT